MSTVKQIARVEEVIIRPLFSALQTVADPISNL